jgi:hypothetical protein
MLARLGAVRPAALASPVRSAFVRSLRQCAPALQSDVTTRGQISSVAANDASKFVEAETLEAHQQRTRHADPANRTFNYALLGVPLQTTARCCAAASASPSTRRRVTIYCRERMAAVAGQVPGPDEPVCRRARACQP